MPKEGFLLRWSRLKSGGGPAEPVAGPAPAPAPASTAVAEPAAQRQERTAAAPAPPPPPTLEDAARLTPDADFSAFVATGVDRSVQRLALKKLFADPHFNAIDGLDMYMSDYNKASPLAPEMLAALKHAPGLLSRLLGDPDQEADPAQAGQAAQRMAAEGQVPAPAHESGPAHALQHEPPEHQRGQPSTDKGTHEHPIYRHPAA